MSKKTVTFLKPKEFNLLHNLSNYTLIHLFIKLLRLFKCVVTRFLRNIIYQQSNNSSASVKIHILYSFTHRLHCALNYFKHPFLLIETYFDTVFFTLLLIFFYRTLHQVSSLSWCSIQEFSQWDRYCTFHIIELGIIKFKKYITAFCIFNKFCQILDL